MSTQAEFENAPIGATATSPDGRKVYRRETKTLVGADWVRGEGGAKRRADADGLASSGYILAPAPSPAPTTAREALDLAWELAHPVKEGQHIPAGTNLLGRYANNHLSAYPTRVDFIITARESLSIRTLDPLPDPEPDWLDAPAVLARAEGFSYRRTWVPAGDGYWVSVEDGLTNWDALIDVTPLWPKEDA